MGAKTQAFDYKTHILIGCASNGKMTVICHWQHLPRQTEVDRAVQGLQAGYVTFLLCTPTSILPANPIEEREPRSSRA